MNKKTAAWIQLIASCVLVLFLTAFLVFGIRNNGFSFPFLQIGSVGNADKYSAGNGEIETTDEYLKEINVDWIKGSVRIVGSDDASVISIQETAKDNLDEKNKVHYYYHDGILDVRYRTPGSFFYFGTLKSSKSKDLVITVPTKMCSTEYLTLSTDVTSSSVTIQNIDVKKLETDSVSGSVTYEGNAAAIQCDTVSGDCTLISHQTPSSVETDGVSANITLQVPDSSVFSANYDGVSGKLSVNGFEQSNITKKDIGEAAYVVGCDESRTPDCKYEFDSVSGDVTITTDIR
jgi:hypothetical protein